VIGLMSTKEDAYQKHSRREMLRVFSSMCSNSKGWQKTTRGAPPPTQTPGEAPHETSYRDDTFAPMTSFQLCAVLASPGNLVENRIASSGEADGL